MTAPAPTGARRETGRVPPSAGRGLVIGFGNPGRGDDGLGPRLVEVLGERGIGGTADLVEVFQLSLEHAAEVAGRRWVVFADAAAEGPEPFSVRPLLAPGRSAGAAGGFLGFTTHDLAPEAVLGIAEAAFGGRPMAWLLAIRGYRFGLADRLSRKASANLAAAMTWVESVVVLLGERGENDG